jgi:hypothetical protein
MKFLKELLTEMAEELPEQIVAQLEKRAAAEREAGGSIEIEPGLPSISITLSDGSEYFFQEWEADELLEKVPANITHEDYLLAIAQNW